VQSQPANDNNTLLGTACNNIINGNGGNDYIEGRNGNDTLNGGTGFNDQIFGGNDNDSITDPDGILGAHGGTGNDSIVVTFAANWDNDTNPNNAPRSDGKITGGFGDDNITVTMNKSGFFLNLKGDEPASNTANDGNDTVTLQGTYGNSVIDLGGGNDTFNGGSGNDLLRGGLGNDILIGGSNTDTFVLAAGEGRDTISDFVQGTDFIGLSDGLTFASLSFSGSSILSGSETLAVLTGITTSNLTVADFLVI
jgi:Ca2+-binding RTX toxin-like protein